MTIAAPRRLIQEWLGVVSVQRPLWPLFRAREKCRSSAVLENQQLLLLTSNISVDLIMHIIIDIL